MRIPVVFATDSNYIFYTCIAITSLAESSRENTFYDIYIMVKENSVSLEDWIERLHLKYQNIHVQILIVNTQKLANAEICNSHVTKATFYRLLLGSMLQEEKCIYLDADIIVTEDLSELFQTDIREYYLAGCRDIWIDMMTEKEREDRRQKTQIPSMEHYINAGVLLINLDLIRREGIEKIFLSHLGKKYAYEDQDILNVCCYKKIKHLPQKWNLFTLFMGQITELRKKGICEQTVQMFIKKSGIIHYATPFIRPWERFFCWANREWWQIASIWMETDEYKSVIEKVEKLEEQNEWKYYIERCRGYKTIMIFGYTKYSKEVCDWICKLGDYSLYFCDNNTEKQGESYHNIKVISLQNAVKNRDRVLFLIVSQNRKEEMKKLLLAEGIQERDIVCYQTKTREYYLYLDKRYYQKEIEDIFYKEYIDKNREETPSQFEKMQAEISEDMGWTERYYLKDWLLKESEV